MGWTGSLCYHLCNRDLYLCIFSTSTGFQYSTPLFIYPDPTADVRCYQGVYYGKILGGYYTSYSHDSHDISNRMSQWLSDSVIEHREDAEYLKSQAGDLFLKLSNNATLNNKKG